VEIFSLILSRREGHQFWRLDLSNHPFEAVNQVVQVWRKGQRIVEGRPIDLIQERKTEKGKESAWLIKLKGPIGV
jgi:hypothetical protein